MKRRIVRRRNRSTSTPSAATWSSASRSTRSSEKAHETRRRVQPTVPTGTGVHRSPGNPPTSAPDPFTSRSRVPADRRRIDRIIDEEMADRRANPTGNPLDILEVLATDCTLTDREIRDQVDTLIGAGYDTTASTFAWLLWRARSNRTSGRSCAPRRIRSSDPWTSHASRSTKPRPADSGTHGGSSTNRFDSTRPD